MPKPRKTRERADVELDARLGVLLRQRRLELGMSQSTLGAKLRLTFQQIQKYERGANQISVGRLLQICRVLGTPVDYFLGDTTKPAGFAATDIKVTRTLSQVRNPRVKQAFLRLAKSIA